MWIIGLYWYELNILSGSGDNESKKNFKKDERVFEKLFRKEIVIIND